MGALTSAAQADVATRRPVRAVLRRALVGTAHVVVRSDLALVVSGVITALTIALTLSPDGVVQQVVSSTSTNLANLRTHPVPVLVASLFVVPDLEGLLLVLVLLVALAYGQQWVGRFATVVVAVIGHVGATLFVAILLITGLGAHLIPRSVVYAEDVGVSYALAALLGWLSARVPRRWRVWYIAMLVLYFLGPALFSQTFTDAGHATALVIGLSLAVLSARSAQGGPVRSASDDAVGGIPLAADDERRSVRPSGKEVVEE